MSDLISRQAAIDAVHYEFDECLVWDESGQTTADEVERILDYLPSADAVPVVRCKDCKHRGKELCLMYYVDEGGFGYDLTRDSDYCVFGERKE